MRAKFWSLAVVMLAVVLLVGCGGVKSERSVTLSLDAPQGETLEIISRNGAITVLEDDTLTAVAVVAKLRARAATQAEADARVASAQVLVASEGSTVSISTAFPEGFRNGDGASFTVRTPRGWREAIIRTSNGGVRIEGLSAPSDIDTSNGAVTVVGQTGDVRIDTSNGRIEVVGLDGSIVADTSNGGLVFEDVSGAIKASSSNGSINLKLQGEQSGPFALSSSNGGVRIRVGSGFHGVIDARTSNGSMSMKGDRMAAVEMLGKRHGRATVGEGGAESTVSTSNGSVTVTAGS